MTWLPDRWVADRERREVHIPMTGLERVFDSERVVTNGRTLTVEPTDDGGYLARLGDYWGKDRTPEAALEQLVAAWERAAQTGDD